MTTFFSFPPLKPQQRFSILSICEVLGLVGVYRVYKATISMIMKIWLELFVSAASYCQLSPIESNMIVLREVLVLHTFIMYTDLRT